MFTDPQDHLENALQRLDLLLHREILRLRAGYALSLDEFRGLYVSDEQVDALVTRMAGRQRDGLEVRTLTERAGALRREHAERFHKDLPWARLVTTFDLSPFEQDVLLLAVAPEIDLKYETLYAYLNNDVGRPWPTFDLALRLFSEDRIGQRRLLLPEATLVGSGLVRPLKSGAVHPSWLAVGFSVASPVVRSLLGLDVWDEKLTPFVQRESGLARWEDLSQSGSLVASLQRVAKHYKSAEGPRPVFVFEGRSGAGRAQAAGALCRALGRPLLRLDVEALRAASEWPDVVRMLTLQQRLEPAGLYVERSEALVGKERQPTPEARRMVAALGRLRGPVVFACSPTMPWRLLLQGARHLVLRFDEPDYPQRRRLWSHYLDGYEAAMPDEALNELAERFILNPGQIGRASTAAYDAKQVQDAVVSWSDALFEAARAESGARLGQLATKVELIHVWDDLVLPPATLRRVREIAAAVRHRHLVYAQWGFARRIAAGRGLKVLFTGPPGTGKTMTASVIAHDLGLDLYKVDLSGVVSKYIGETEKNLDRIFHAARASNAILFFDEADALFGKRSEVKDAHDRYANIETSYLLQKMEEHEGAVMLATNLRKNMDEAFSRRMHYVVEFPVPDEGHREQLWRGMFPSDVPLGDDVDLRFLARQFTLSGGDIQNVALDAAFLAAQDGRVVCMRQLVNAMARQLQKQGRLASPTDFKQYHGLITKEG